MANVVRFPESLHGSPDALCYVGRRAITSTNPWTQFLDVSAPIDERWIFDLDLATLKGDRADLYEAVLAQVQATSGYLSVFNPSRPWPKGTATGLVKGQGARFSDGSAFSDGTEFQDGITSCVISAVADRGSTYIRLAGLEADQAVGFKVGDMIAISPWGTDTGFLHRVVANAPTDADGACAIRVDPALRAPVFIGEHVRLHKPRGVFGLSDPNGGNASRVAGNFLQPSLSLVEAPEVILCAL